MVFRLKCHQTSDPGHDTGKSDFCTDIRSALDCGESVIELFRMKEKWILYRKVGNDLMREGRQYAMKAGGYQDGDEEKNFRIFVANAENIISEESSSWKQMIQNIKSEKV